MVSLNFKLLISFNSYIVSDFLYRASRFTTLNDYGKAFFSILASLPEKVSNMKFLRIFGKKTLNPVLWYVNRKSITRAVFVGTFLVYCLFLFTAYLL